MSEQKDVFSPVAYSHMTQFSPFPAHVHSYLYSGKTVNLINQRGVNVDMKREVFRHVMETTEMRMKEQHFRYATKGTFARAATPVLKVRDRKKSRKTTLCSQLSVAIKKEEQRLDTKEDSESEVEVEPLPPPVIEGPFQPSQRLLDFLRDDSHRKTKSLATTRSLPRLNYLSRQKTCNHVPILKVEKPVIRKLYLKMRPTASSLSQRKEFQPLRRSLEPDFISVAILGL